MSKIGLQSQSGIIVDLGKILQKKPVSYKLLGNALNLGVARTIREQSPQTFLVIRTGSNWAVDDNGFIQRYADEASALAGPYLNAGLCDLLEPPNEPVVQTVELAKLLNDRQVQYAQIMRARGFRVGAYNFSVGNPDYGLWPFLLDGIRASDYWLLLHEYGAPSMQANAASLSLRHRIVYENWLPADIQQRLKIGITESGIDLGSIGGAGGYRRMPKPPNDRRIIDVFLEQLTWYDSELAKDPYVQWVNMFGYDMQEPWVGLGFDLAEVEEERNAFVDWLQGGVVNAGGTNPPVDPPQGEKVITSDEIKSAIPYLVKVAQAAGMGASVYGERDIKAGDGKTYHLWMFDRGGVGTEDGKYGPADAFYFDPVTYAISKTPPVVTQPPNTQPPGTIPPFNPALAVAPAYLEETPPIVGKPFYRVTGMTKQYGVGAFCYVSVQKLDGSAAIGVKVVNQWLGSQNGEVVVTDGTGVARFQFGSSAAVPDLATGHYPFSFAVTLDGFKDTDAKVLHLGSIISDWVRGCGDDNSSHTQIEIQMRQVA